MTSASAFVVAIGQLPPPITGLSYITAQMIDAIKGTYPIHVANVAAEPNLSGMSKHLRRMLRVLAAGLILFKHLFRTNRRCYLVCEGDWGLVYTIFLAALARLCGYRTALHHHSFAYIDRPRALMRLLLNVGGPALTHIFLCPIMRSRFASAYNIEPKACIISNLAFVEPQLKCQCPTGPLTIGLLSNLTKEKGLHTFLQLVASAQAQGLGVKAILAGPIASETDRKLVENASRGMKDALDYRGPVYGPSKEKFYHDIDIFVFPTEYSHEAEPTVVFEAISSGSVVIAFNRGCISNQIGAIGFAIEPGGNFLEDSIEYLRQATAQVVRLRDERRSRIEAYRKLHSSNSDVTKRLFHDLAD